MDNRYKIDTENTVKNVEFMSYFFILICPPKSENRLKHPIKDGR